MDAKWRKTWDVHATTSISLLSHKRPVVRQVAMGGKKAGFETFDSVGNGRRRRMGFLKKIFVDLKNKDGWTGLMVAANRGDASEVKSLIAAGANVNKTSTNGTFTALTLACMTAGRGVECVKALIAAGADVNAKDKERGGTALMVSRSCPEYMSLLIAAGADVNARDKAGYAALMIAHANLDCVNVLIAAGADVNVKGSDGATALILAAKAGNANCVKAIAAAGADLNARTLSGATALGIAESEKNLDCVLALKDLFSSVEGKREGRIHEGNTRPGEWFKNASMRGSPHLPSDFNLFEIPCYLLDEWTHRVSGEPHRLQCIDVAVRDLSLAVQQLFGAIKKEHGLEASPAVALFDRYLGAACPKCFHGITGNALQMAAGLSQMNSVVGSGPALQRILGGRCPTCESDHVYLVWHGDKSVREAAVVEKLSEQQRKSIFLEFEDFMRTTAMIEAVSRGLAAEAGLEYALDKASEHIMHSHGLSFEQWKSIYLEARNKKWRE